MGRSNKWNRLADQMGLGMQKFQDAGETEPEESVSLWDKAKNIYNWRENLAENITPKYYSEYEQDRPWWEEDVVKRSPFRRLYDGIVLDKREESRDSFDDESLYRWPIDNPPLTEAEIAAGKIHQGFYGGPPVHPENNEREDLLNMMLGRAQVHNSILPALYTPTEAEESGVDYYSSPNTEREIKSIIEYFLNNGETEPNYRSVKGLDTAERLVLEGLTPQERIAKMVDKGYYGTSLGNYKMDLGEDEEGSYVSYYDKWDVSPFSDERIGSDILPRSVEEALQSLSGLSPTELYGRIYYDTETGIPIEKKQLGGDLPKAQLGGAASKLLQFAFKPASKKLANPAGLLKTSSIPSAFSKSGFSKGQQTFFFDVLKNNPALITEGRVNLADWERLANQRVADIDVTSITDLTQAPYGAGNYSSGFGNIEGSTKDVDLGNWGYNSMLPIDNSFSSRVGSKLRWRGSPTADLNVRPDVLHFGIPDLVPGGGYTLPHHAGVGYGKEGTLGWARGFTDPVKPTTWNASEIQNDYGHSDMLNLLKDSGGKGKIRTGEEMEELTALYSNKYDNLLDFSKTRDKELEELLELIKVKRAKIAEGIPINEQHQYNPLWRNGWEKENLWELEKQATELKRSSIWTKNQVADFKLATGNDNLQLSRLLQKPYARQEDALFNYLKGMGHDRIGIPDKQTISYMQGWRNPYETYDEPFDYSNKDYASTLNYYSNLQKRLAKSNKPESILPNKVGNFNYTTYPIPTERILPFKQGGEAISRTPDEIITSVMGNKNYKNEKSIAPSKAQLGGDKTDRETAEDYLRRWVNSDMFEEMRGETNSPSMNEDLDYMLNNTDWLNASSDSISRMFDDGNSVLAAADHKGFSPGEIRIMGLDKMKRFPLRPAVVMSDGVDKGTALHEYSHIFDGITGIPKKDVDRIKELYQSEEGTGQYPQDYVDYIADPTETIARLRSLRSVSEGLPYEDTSTGETKVWDAFKEPATLDMLRSLPSSSPEFGRILLELKTTYGEEVIIKLLNEIADSGEPSDDGMAYAQKGGEQLPKAQFGKGLSRFLKSNGVKDGQGIQKLLKSFTNSNSIPHELQPLLTLGDKTKEMKAFLAQYNVPYNTELEGGFLASGSFDGHPSEASVNWMVKNRPEQVLNFTPENFRRGMFDVDYSNWADSFLTGLRGVTADNTGIATQAMRNPTIGRGHIHGDGTYLTSDVSILGAKGSYGSGLNGYIGAIRDVPGLGQRGQKANDIVSEISLLNSQGSAFNKYKDAAGNWLKDAQGNTIFIKNPQGIHTTGDVVRVTRPETTLKSGILDIAKSNDPKALSALLAKHGSNIDWGSLGTYGNMNNKGLKELYEKILLLNKKNGGDIPKAQFGKGLTRYLKSGVKNKSTGYLHDMLERLLPSRTIDFNPKQISSLYTQPKKILESTPLLNFASSIKPDNASHLMDSRLGTDYVLPEGISTDQLYSLKRNMLGERGIDEMYNHLVTLNPQLGSVLNSSRNKNNIIQGVAANVHPDEMSYFNMTSGLPGGFGYKFRNQFLQDPRWGSFLSDRRLSETHPELFQKPLQGTIPGEGLDFVLPPGIQGQVLDANNYTGPLNRKADYEMWHKYDYEKRLAEYMKKSNASRKEGGELPKAQFGKSLSRLLPKFKNADFMHPTYKTLRTSGKSTYVDDIINANRRVGTQDPMVYLHGTGSSSLPGIINAGGLTSRATSLPMTGELTGLGNNINHINDNFLSVAPITNPDLALRYSLGTSGQRNYLDEYNTFVDELGTGRFNNQDKNIFMGEGYADKIKDIKYNRLDTWNSSSPSTKLLLEENYPMLFGLNPKNTEMGAERYFSRLSNQSGSEAAIKGPITMDEVSNLYVPNSRIQQTTDFMGNNIGNIKINSLEDFGESLYSPRGGDEGVRSLQNSKLIDFNNILNKYKKEGGSLPKAQLGKEIVKAVSKIKNSPFQDYVKWQLAQHAQQKLITPSIGNKIYRGVYLNDEIRSSPKFADMTDDEILEIMGTQIPGSTGTYRKRQFNNTLNFGQGFEAAADHIRRFTNPGAMYKIGNTNDYTSGQKFVLEVEPNLTLPFKSVDTNNSLYQRTIEAWRKENPNAGITIDHAAKDFNPSIDYGSFPFRTEGQNVVEGNFPQFVGNEGDVIGKLLKAKPIKKSGGGLLKTRTPNEIIESIMGNKI